MGCSGGSLMYGLEENIQAFRVVDGLGNAAWAEKGSELFAAVGVSMGLQGIITRVRLKLTPLFSVYGQERTTAVAHSPIDLFDDGTPDTPSLRTFLEQTPYSRILWWPQPGAERIVTWMAVPGPPLHQGVQVPYAEFGTNPAGAQVQELAAAILFTLAGNLDDLSVVPKKLDNDFKAFKDALEMVRVVRPGGLVLTAEPTNITWALLPSIALGETVEQAVSMLRFQLVCEQGKKALGEGTNLIGESVPRLFVDAGLEQVEIRMNDRPWALLPPYESDFEPAVSLSVGDHVHGIGDRSLEIPDLLDLVDEPCGVVGDHEHVMRDHA